VKEGRGGKQQSTHHHRSLSHQAGHQNGGRKQKERRCGVPDTHHKRGGRERHPRQVGSVLRQPAQRKRGRQECRRIREELEALPQNYLKGCWTVGIGNLVRGPEDAEVWMRGRTDDTDGKHDEAGEHGLDQKPSHCRWLVAQPCGRPKILRRSGPENPTLSRRMSGPSMTSSAMRPVGRRDA
jgi:hypothetical protein